MFIMIENENGEKTVINTNYILYIQNEKSRTDGITMIHRLYLTNKDSYELNEDDYQMILQKLNL